MKGHIDRDCRGKGKGQDKYEGGGCAKGKGKTGKETVMKGTGKSVSSVDEFDEEQCDHEGEEDVGGVRRVGGVEDSEHEG